MDKSQCEALLDIFAELSEKRHASLEGVRDRLRDVIVAEMADEPEPRPYFALGTNDPKVAVQL